MRYVTKKKHVSLPSRKKAQSISENYVNYAKRVVVVVVGTPQKRGVCANEANVKLRKVNAPKKKKTAPRKLKRSGGSAITLRIRRVAGQSV